MQACEANGAVCTWPEVGGDASFVKEQHRPRTLPENDGQIVRFQETKNQMRNSLYYAAFVATLNVQKNAHGCAAQRFAILLHAEVEVGFWTHTGKIFSGPFPKGLFLNW